MSAIFWVHDFYDTIFGYAVLQKNNYLVGNAWFACRNKIKINSYFLH